VRGAPFAEDPLRPDAMTEFTSSTTAIPEPGDVPRHVAIIMDGNGRWAKKRFLPRVGGHRRGVEAVREVVKTCMQRGCEYLTLFAFSSENWRRPKDEVTFLMQLFLRSLESEVSKLHENGIRFKVVGDLSAFDAPIVELIRRGEELTRDNTRLTLTIAANYGGRWDVLQAANRCREDDPAVPITEERLAARLSMAYAPEPDLFIRTGGEQRISQLAYSELYFTDALWPDFNAAALDEAFASYRRRERRFGRTSEQLASAGPVTQAV
jgi:undecaprenyl diphosphate synthase